MLSDATVRQRCANDACTGGDGGGGGATAASVPEAQHLHRLWLLFTRQLHCCLLFLNTSSPTPTRSLPISVTSAPTSSPSSKASSRPPIVSALQRCHGANPILPNLG
eukprot:SM000139S00091  [mRNA]  locus=s139:83143:83489:+ [translate_table: standard]